MIEAKLQTALWDAVHHAFAVRDFDTALSLAMIREELRRRANPALSPPDAARAALEAAPRH